MGLEDLGSYKGLRWIYWYVLSNVKDRLDQGKQERGSDIDEIQCNPTGKLWSTNRTIELSSPWGKRSVLCNPDNLVIGQELLGGIRGLSLQERVTCWVSSPQSYQLKIGWPAEWIQLQHQHLLQGSTGQVLSPTTDGSVSGEPACNAGDLALHPGLGRSPGEENGNPLQYPCLEKPMEDSQGSLAGYSPWGHKESDMT